MAGTVKSWVLRTLAFFLQESDDEKFVVQYLGSEVCCVSCVCVWVVGWNVVHGFMVQSSQSC